MFSTGIMWINSMWSSVLPEVFPAVFPAYTQRSKWSVSIWYALFSPLMKFFDCCYSACQMVGNVFLAGFWWGTFLTQISTVLTYFHNNIPTLCVQTTSIMTSVTKALLKWHYIMLCNLITEIFTGIHLAWSLNWCTEGGCKSYNL